MTHSGRPPHGAARYPSRSDNGASPAVRQRAGDSRVSSGQVVPPPQVACHHADQRITTDDLAGITVANAGLVSRLGRHPGPGRPIDGQHHVIGDVRRDPLELQLPMAQASSRCRDSMRDNRFLRVVQPTGFFKARAISAWRNYRWPGCQRAFLPPASRRVERGDPTGRHTSRSASFHLARSLVFSHRGFPHWWC